MAIKRGSKVDKSFSSSAMTDLMFLLLIFMIIATTLINANALPLELPKSSNQMADRAGISVSIKQVGNRYDYYVNTDKVSGIGGIERELNRRLEGQKEPIISLHCDKSVAIDEVVKVMNIAKANNYRLRLATQAQNK